MISHYNTEQFAIFMLSRFNIDINRRQIGEETILLYKDEIDTNIVSGSLLDITPELTLVYIYIYETEGIEWMVCVVSDADTNNPLFLICLKDGEKVYEKLLKK